MLHDQYLSGRAVKQYLHHEMKWHDSKEGVTPWEEGGNLNKRRQGSRKARGMKWSARSLKHKRWYIGWIRGKLAGLNPIYAMR